MLKKIVIIGPESTGKSTLCQQLAAHFNTLWCPEYAREYLNTNGIKYDYNDLKKITEGQLIMENSCEEKLEAQSLKFKAETSQLLFIDTNMYVMKVWYEYVFGKCEQLVLNEISKRKYSLYFLCNIDLPWIEEPMREYPGEQSRAELYNMYKDILVNETTPWIEISGSYNLRLQKAIEAVEKYFLL